MTAPLWLIDTNVVCAGLVTRDAASPTALIVDAMVAGTMGHAVTLPMAGEYDAVFCRPKLQRLHGLGNDELEQVVAALVRHAVMLEAPAAQASAQVSAPDAGDQFLWDALAANSRAALITGDKRLWSAAPMQGRVLSPADWAARQPRT
jgi:uncharacterized protein